MGTEIKICKRLVDHKTEILQAWNTIVEAERQNHALVLSAIKGNRLDRALEMMETDRMIGKIKMWLRKQIP